MLVELVLRSPLNGAKVPVAVTVVDAAFSGASTGTVIVVVWDVVGAGGFVSEVSITGCKTEVAEVGTAS